MVGSLQRDNRAQSIFVRGPATVKIALLCSGLGRIHRGHETFARDLFELLRDSVDISLFKGGGDTATNEQTIDNLPRDSIYLRHIHVATSPKWAEARCDQERVRIEGETFAYAALKPLLQGEFDVIHCLEQEVCEVIYANRHLFARTPRVLFSNGGALARSDLPHCDFVQEYTDHNLRRSDRRKAFVIPHGVDTTRFRPGVPSEFRDRRGIPADAFVAISVGSICRWHKRMDYVIREVAPLGDVHLLVVGEDTSEAPAIRSLGRELMDGRIHFATLPHNELPAAYAAANVFVLGSLFETFGIVYIEAMAMGLPVICTNHVNQRSIVKDGVFVDMARSGALNEALRRRDSLQLARLSQLGRMRAEQEYDLHNLRHRYLERYRAIAAAPSSLPRYSLKTRLFGNGRDVLRRSRRLLGYFAR